MMPLEVTQTNETRPNGIGPGDRLQAARIEKGLSVEAVANRMHLSVSILESIEENNFDDITAPIFVKGYLRAYARIVSLDEEEMIQQYIDFYSQEDPPIITTNNSSAQFSSNDARIKWITYIVIFVLFGLVAAWWWNTNQTQNQSSAVSLGVDAASVRTSEIAIDQNPEVEISSLSEPVLEETETIALVEQSINSMSTEVPTEPVVENVIIEEPVVEVANVEILNTEEIADEQVSTEAETVSEPAVSETSESIVTAADIAASVSQRAPLGNDILNLTIHVDTWADIKDSNGHRLAYNLLRADNELTFTGQAPFTVFLGNGHGVELYFNNEEVDISSRIRNDNTARLKIGIN